MKESTKKVMLRTNPIEIAQLDEWEAWKEICKCIQETFNMSEREFNASIRIKDIIKAIEKWGYFEMKRRQALFDFGNDTQKQYAIEARSIFWNGE